MPSRRGRKRKLQVGQYVVIDNKEKPNWEFNGWIARVTGLKHPFGMIQMTYAIDMVSPDGTSFNRNGFIRDPNPQVRPATDKEILLARLVGL